MKGFTRGETRFSLCGLNCLLCPMHVGGHCPGCGGGPGNQSCPIARCSLDHGGVPFCWVCQAYPCPRYEDFDKGDSFVPHQNRQQDITQAQALGQAAYLAQLEDKRAILDTLLTGYNDGRRKSLFCRAVYLLPLEALQAVMHTLEAQPPGQSLKERALSAAGLLQGEAERRGICLKPRKKPKKG